MVCKNKHLSLSQKKHYLNGGGRSTECHGNTDGHSPWIKGSVEEHSDFTALGQVAVPLKVKNNGEHDSIPATSVGEGCSSSPSLFEEIECRVSEDICAYPVYVREELMNEMW